jgi:hypothetical protein
MMFDPMFRLGVAHIAVGCLRLAIGLFAVDQFIAYRTWGKRKLLMLSFNCLVLAMIIITNWQLLLAP